MAKRKLPLDPFDWRTAFDRDVQTGKAAIGVAAMGLVAAALLVSSPSLGWIRFLAAGMLLAFAFTLARRLWQSL